MPIQRIGARSERRGSGRRQDCGAIELAATKRANELLKVAVPPKGRFAAVAKMAEEGHPIQIAARVLEVSVREEP